MMKADYQNAYRVVDEYISSPDHLQSYISIIIAFLNVKLSESILVSLL